MNEGMAAGRMTVRNAVNRRAPRMRPARRSTGEMLSMPDRKTVQPSNIASSMSPVFMLSFWMQSSCR